VLLLLLLFIQTETGCSRSEDTANNRNASVGNSSSVSAVVPKDNIDELLLLVNLPFAPEEVSWEEKPGENIIAVVRFSPENAMKMSAEIAKQGEPAPETIAVETWYPAELIAQGELSGESTIQGKTYPAAAFLTPPYTKGKITRIDNTDYFILQISS